MRLPLHRHKQGQMYSLKYPIHYCCYRLCRRRRRLVIAIIIRSPFVVVVIVNAIIVHSPFVLVSRVVHVIAGGRLGSITVVGGGLSIGSITIVGGGGGLSIYYFPIQSETSDNVIRLWGHRNGRRLPERRGGLHGMIIIGCKSSDGRGGDSGGSGGDGGCSGGRIGGYDGGLFLCNRGKDSIILLPLTHQAGRCTGGCANVGSFLLWHGITIWMSWIGRGADTSMCIESGVVSGNAVRVDKSDRSRISTIFNIMY